MGRILPSYPSKPRAKKQITNPSAKYPDLWHGDGLVLDWIIERIASEDSSPSLEEVAEAFGFTCKPESQRAVDRIEEAGYLDRPRHSRRGIRLNYERLPGPLLRVKDRRVVVANMPKRMTAAKARMVGEALLEAADELDGGG